MIPKRKRRVPLRLPNPKRELVRQAKSLVAELDLDLSGLLTQLRAADLGDRDADSVTYLNNDLERLYKQLGVILNDIKA